MTNVSVHIVASVSDELVRFRQRSLAASLRGVAAPNHTVFPQIVRDRDPGDPHPAAVVVEGPHAVVERRVPCEAAFIVSLFELVLLYVHSDHNYIQVLLGTAESQVSRFGPAVRR